MTYEPFSGVPGDPTASPLCPAAPLPAFVPPPVPPVVTVTRQARGGAKINVNVIVRKPKEDFELPLDVLALAGLIDDTALAVFALEGV